MNHRSAGVRIAHAFVALALGCAVPNAAIAMLAQPVPIEIEMQLGATPFSLGGNEFERGWLAGLRKEELRVQSANGSIRTISNSFCLASERPIAKPLHVRLEVSFDGTARYDYPPDSPPGSIQSADHWLVHVAVPLRGIRRAPGVSQRMSFWARSDRPEYRENMGRVIALSVLEALNRETGKISRDERLVLGPDITRDGKYSEGGNGSRPDLWNTVVLATPMVLAWGTALLIAIFIVARFAGVLRRRRRH